MDSHINIKIEIVEFNIFIFIIFLSNDEHFSTSVLNKIKIVSAIITAQSNNHLENLYHIKYLFL